METDTTQSHDDPADKQPTDNQPTDQAMADRLQRLGSMPVDTARLERMLYAQLPARKSTTASFGRWMRPLRAVAASIAIGAVILGLILSTSGGPVLASATDMAQFHNDMVSGRVPVMQVDSVSEANRALATQWKQSPQMPTMPDDHAMACCMRSVKNKKVACVLMKGDGEPITMTVANAADMKSPGSVVETRNGIAYHVQTAGNLNMVMTERDGRWVCLISKLPASRLMDLASSLEF